MLRRITVLTIIVIFTACMLTWAETPKAKTSSTDKTSKRKLPTSNYKGKMSLDDDYFEFGYMPLGMKVGHVFWLKNVGMDSLEIIRINPG